MKNESYNNPKKRKWGPPGHTSTSTTKPNIHGKKIHVVYLVGSAWCRVLWVAQTEWDYWGSLPNTIDEIEPTLKEKRAHYYSRHDKLILLHDNARPHVAAPVKTYLETLKWEVLSPPYSPDIAPSDYHLFRSMTHGLSEQHFTPYEDTKNCIDDWIASKDEAFFRRDKDGKKWWPLLKTLSTVLSQ